MEHYSTVKRKRPVHHEMRIISGACILGSKGCIEYVYYRVGLLFVDTSRLTFVWFSVLWLWYTKLYEHLSVNLCVDICLFLLGKYDKCVYMTFWRKQNSRYSQEEVSDSKWRDESEIIYTYLIIWRDKYKTIKKRERENPKEKLADFNKQDI